MDNLIKILEIQRVFITNVHQLTNALSIKDEDAAHLLATELYTLKRDEFTDFVGLVVERDKNALWRITFTKRDIVRHYFGDKKNQAKVTDASQTSYIDFAKGMNFVRDNEIDKVIEVIPKMFTNSNTQEFVAWVLEFGAIETMTVLGLSRRQFNLKLRDVERYCRKKRQRFIGVAKSREEQEMIKKKKVLSEIIKLVEGDAYSDIAMSQVIANLHRQGNPTIEQLLGTKGISAPLKLISQFGQPSVLRQSYIFINEAYKQYNKISRKLVEA